MDSNNTIENTKGGADKTNNKEDEDPDSQEEDIRREVKEGPDHKITRIIYKIIFQ